MIQYTCDRCKKVIHPESDLRYTVKVEIQAAMEPLDMDELEDDTDHLLELQEILERLDDADSELIGDDIYQRQRFDLCSECFSHYKKNPLGQELPVNLGFSEN